MGDERVRLQSYRDVFRLAEGRRLYAFGELRISDVVPGGLPVRAIAYFLAATGVIAALSVLPATEMVMDTLPWQLRYLLIPLVCAAAGSVSTPDGRSPHQFALEFLRYALRPKRCVAGAGVPRERQRLELAVELFVVADAGCDPACPTAGRPPRRTLRRRFRRRPPRCDSSRR